MLAALGEAGAFGMEGSRMGVLSLMPSGMHRRLEQCVCTGQAAFRRGILNAQCSICPDVLLLCSHPGGMGGWVGALVLASYSIPHTASPTSLSTLHCLLHAAHLLAPSCVGSAATRAWPSPAGLGAAALSCEQWA